MKLLISAIFVAFLSTAVLSQTAPERVMPSDFRSDRCSLFPDGDYGDCCVEHDKDYYFGGTSAERKASDKRLKACVMSKGKSWKRKWLANAMYLGVRIGGVSWLPTPFRWGFGNKWPQSRPKETATRPTGR